MIAVQEFQGKAVGVLGLARSGLSAARALQAGGARLCAWDDGEGARQVAAKEKIALEPPNRWPWQQIKTLVLSPGIPLTHPEPHPVVRQAKSAGAEVIGDVELFARAVRSGREANGLARIIAVTGTNGKSTTTALIGHILQAAGLDAQVGGNIGKPVLDLGIPTAKTVYVLEVSSYQIELSPGLAPDVAVLTNLSPDHIDRHGSMENYAAVKESLLRHAASDGHVAVGVDDDYSATIYTKLVASRMADAVAVSIGKVLGRGIFVIDGKLYDAWDQPSAQVGDLKAAPHLPGSHNWQNAALAYAAVRRLIRDPRAIFSSILRFPGLAHRIEDAGRIGKVRFVNDSKATNAEAAARALACFPDVFWIAGGRAKDGGIADLESLFPRIRTAYLIGEAAESFGKTLAGKVPAVQSGTLERALKAAFDDARASKADEPVVLLSPACASFDQFRDFEHRGDVFKDLVRALITAPPRPARAGAAS
jgi:UDP-N-acetylmuramoylalanine--D-glutamate ligase